MGLTAVGRGTQRLETDALTRWPLLLALIASLMGGGGVIIAAAGAHDGGGETARIAADFLLIHAAVLLAVCVPASLAALQDRWLLTALTILAVGVVVFSAELTLASLADWRPLPLAAPVGGFLMIAGWVLLAVAFVRRLTRGGN